MRLKLVATTCLAVVLASCATSQPDACGPANCGGCCDAAGACLLVDPSVCAGPGSACSTCNTQCTPECTDRVCGGDGCGGTCGTCPAGQGCSTSGECVTNVVDGCMGVTAAGICESATTVKLCTVATGNAEPTLSTYSCQGGESCQTVGGKAACVLTGNCREGETKCTSPTQLQSCTQGTQATVACPGQCTTTGLGALCTSAIATKTLTATLRYEYRGPNAARPTDWSAVQTAPANRILIVSCLDGSCMSGNILDAVYTDAEGKFTVRVRSTPSAADLVAAIAVSDNGAEDLGFLVADPGFAAAGTQEYNTIGPQARAWSWSLSVAAANDNDVFTVTEAQGSGALNVYSVLRASYDFVRSKNGGNPGKRVVVWVGVGTSWSCGACFAPVPSNFLDIPFEAGMWIGGDDSQQYWADAVTVHELGHWAMASYGTTPGEGGKHCLGTPSFPGLSWSEGWATWFSSNVRQSPQYYDKQGGTFFWFDISQREYSSAVPWQRPTANGGLLQLVDENEVASIAYALVASGVGDAPLFDALRSPRMNGQVFSRGYSRRQWDVDPNTCAPVNAIDTGLSAPFLADFLDALVCSGVSATRVNAAIGNFPFPSNAPICQ